MASRLFYRLAAVSHNTIRDILVGTTLVFANLALYQSQQNINHCRDMLHKEQREYLKLAEECARDHKQHQCFANIVERSLLNGSLVPGHVAGDPKAHQDWQLCLEKLRTEDNSSNGNDNV